MLTEISMQYFLHKKDIINSIQTEIPYSLLHFLAY